MRARDPARRLLVLFFLSGVSGLAYELIFSKLLGYIFGTTAYATATVLASFMAGLAGGSALISRFADRLRRPLRVYATLEIGIGLYMIAVPVLMRLVQASYVELNDLHALSLAKLNAIRFLLGGAIVVIPSALMGATLPLLARHFLRFGPETDAIVARLYATNTFGAAAGTLVANYLLLPWTGIYGAIGAGVLVNLIVGAKALRLDRESDDSSATVRSSPTLAPVAESPPVARDRLLLLCAGLTGFLAFAYEVVWTHLLGVVVGTSIYAFGDMLFAMLLGIAAGSLWLARHPAAARTQLSRLATCQLGIGVAVALTVPLWDQLPLLFKAAGYLLPGFYLREAVRILAGLLVMAIPTFLMGISLPLLIESLGGGDRRLGRRVGSAYALNTLGAILGSVLTGFVVLPAVGSRLALLAAAAASVLLGVALLWLPDAAGGAIRRRWTFGAPAAVLAAAVAFPGWNYRALLSGYNVYFVSGAKYDRLLYVHEDVHGGITSVAERAGGEIELRTNGKFQGNNRGQVDAQRAFALIPALFVRQFDRAAVIGLGTGVTAATLARFPFQRIDIAELAPGIVEAARRFFPEVNNRVLDDPRVRLHLEDGRNMLLLDTHARYDLVTVEITSIWFAGAANVYSRDFFELVRSRLSPGGVFQQWVQFHHIDPVDILRILNTARQVFPHVTLWRSGGQGLLVASDAPLRGRYGPILARASEAAVGDLVSALPLHNPLALFGDLLLDEAQVDSAIGFIRAKVGPELTRRLFISSDMLPWLEYSTPRGNAISNEYGATLKFFENYDARRPPPVDGIPDDTERDLVTGLAALRKGNSGNALRLLELVSTRRPDDRALAELVQQLRRQVEAHPL